MYFSSTPFWNGTEIWPKHRYIPIKAQTRTRTGTELTTLVQQSKLQKKIKRCIQIRQLAQKFKVILADWYTCEHSQSLQLFSLSFLFLAYWLKYFLSSNKTMELTFSYPSCSIRTIILRKRGKEENCMKFKVYIYVWLSQQWRAWQILLHPNQLRLIIKRYHSIYIYI